MASRRDRLWITLPVLAALGVVWSCSYDFGAPFRETEKSPTTTSSTGGTSGGPGPPLDDPTCGFDDDYSQALGSPTSWFRLDEAAGDYTAKVGDVPLNGFRKTSVAKIARGAIRSPNGAQFLAGSQIGFGDAWAALGGILTDGHTPLALELWFRLHSVATDQRLFQKLGSDSKRYFRVTIAAGGTLAFERSGGPTSLSFVVNGMATLGSWHHFVAQVDETNLTIYLDGVKTTRPNSLESAVTTGGPFLLGPIDGDVDELAAYDTPLTDADVTRHMDAATRGACAKGGASVCYGPSSRATCQDGKPVWSDNCSPGEVCVTSSGTPRCITDTCPR